MPAVTPKIWKGAAVSTTITADISSSATSITLSSASGWPSPGAGQIALATLRRATANEERISYTTLSGSTISGVTRGIDDTTARTHSAGDAIEHTIGALVMTELYDFLTLPNAKGDIPVATADNEWARHAAGADDTIPMWDSAQANGLKNASPASTAEIADVATAEAAGTSDTWARGDHAHAVANDAVTYAKMQNISAASRLLGRGSAAGTGDPEEITIGSGLSMSGTSLSASAAATTHTLVRKTADESVTNSTTFQDDDSLLFAVAANEVWTWEILAIVRATTGNDIKFQFAVPSGATILYSVLGTQEAATGGGALEFTASAISGTAGGLGEASNRPLLLKGIVVNGATPGNVVFQWAQNVSNAIATKVMENSYLIAHKIS